MAIKEKGLGPLLVWLRFVSPRRSQTSGALLVCYRSSNANGVPQCRDLRESGKGEAARAWITGKIGAALSRHP